MREEASQSSDPVRAAWGMTSVHVFCVSLSYTRLVCRTHRPHQSPKHSPAPFAPGEKGKMLDILPQQWDIGAVGEGEEARALRSVLVDARELSFSLFFLLFTEYGVEMLWKWRGEEGTKGVSTLEVAREVENVGCSVQGVGAVWV